VEIEPAAGARARPHGEEQAESDTPEHQRRLSSVTASATAPKASTPGPEVNQQYARRWRVADLEQSVVRCILSG